MTRLDFSDSVGAGMGHGDCVRIEYNALGLAHSMLRSSDDLQEEVVQSMGLRWWRDAETSHRS